MSKSSSNYSLNGELIPGHQLFLPVNDLAFTRSYAAFEAMRTYSRVPFLVEKHIQRLLSTARIMRIHHCFSKNFIMETLKKTIAANPGGEKLLRIYITAGDGAGLTSYGKPRLFVLVDDLIPTQSEQKNHGVSLMTYKYVRPTPHAKSTNYTEAVLATIIAKQKKFDEAVYKNAKSELTEGTTYNIIALKHSVWITPIENSLPGITIKTIISLLKKNSQKIIFRNLKLSELKECEALFITSSTREILPVKKVDNIIIKVKHDSELTFPLFSVYSEYVKKYTELNYKKWS